MPSGLVTVFAVTVVATEQLRSGRRVRDWLGDRILLGATMAAGLAALALIILIAYKVLRGAHLAFSEFGLPFVWHSAWDANKGLFGAAPGLFGTAVTSFIALLIATPLALAIALFLSELAPRGVHTLLSSLVEMLAAIPSVVLGLWGILVLGPFLAAHVEPWLHRNLGFIPLFSGSPQSSGILIAGIVLAIMVVPIVASVCRELFLSVPQELEEGALALGATRWEMVRGVVLSSSWSGIAAAVDPRLRPGARRGDRRDAGDRRRLGDPQSTFRPRRHAGQPDRGPVPGRRLEAPDRVALLPRRDPARDRAPDEPVRPAHRAPLRVVPDGGS